jgi:hypothetical protein
MATIDQLVLFRQINSCLCWEAYETRIIMLAQAFTNFMNLNILLVIAICEGCFRYFLKLIV